MPLIKPPTRSGALVDDTLIEWSIHLRDAHHARLRHLAESINDTARRARVALSLVLISAFYLSFMIYLATDKNLLVDKSVEWPQVDIEISITYSYVVVPVLFLYLHAQLLFILSVLTRKRRRFESLAAKGVLSQREYGDWLSAFSVVQSTVFGSSVQQRVLPRVLAWIGIEAVPLALLFIVDVHFVRYQSMWITAIHHAIFVLDLALIVYINWQIFDWRNILSPAMHPLYKCAIVIWRIFVFFSPLILLAYSYVPYDDDEETVAGQGSSNPRRDVCREWVFDRRYLHFARYRGEKVEIKKVNLSGRRLRRITIPKEARLEDVQLVGAELSGACLEHAVLLGDVNFEGARLEGAKLFGISSEVIYSSVAWENEREGGEVIFVRAQLAGATISRARLQGADFSESKARGTKFVEADLQGATFVKAELQDADFSRAQLQQADFRTAKAEGAEFFDANLQGAHLDGTELQGADLAKAVLEEARMWAAILRGADLRGAKLEEADLTGADLRGAKLQGADLRGVQLQEAQLQGAQLWGADLRKVELRGTSLFGAELQGADLRGARLQEADLGGVQLLGLLQGVDLRRQSCWGDISPGRSYGERVLVRRGCDIGMSTTRK